VDLRTELDGDLLVYGSRRLLRALIGMGLVDELRLLVYPLVLGAGGRLFGTRRTSSRCAWSKRVRSGAAW
jgi:dihydrofolate reductase